MENCLSPLFSKLHTEAWSVFGNSQIIMADAFYKSRKLTSEDRVFVVLTANYLCVCDGTKMKDFDIRYSKIIEICQIDFDLKFEVLREITNRQKTVLGNPYGLRFQRDNFESVSLFGNLQTLSKWKIQLEGRINVKGFHNLFKPIKKIGKGNFASVYLAERLQDKKLVAVKAFSKQSTFAQEKGREALINQINLMRKMNQPNVMKLYAIYESQNSIYMAMQLLQGGQLYNKIQAKHRFTSKQTKQIMQGLLQGLDHMHQKRIMHRDLKPENIMLRYSNSYEVVIVDFGLATWAEQQNYLFVRCGTPGYVAPQIINIKDMKTKSDPVCDIFSIGLIFHILLLGKSIFPGRTYNQVLTQNRACDFDLDDYTYNSIPSSSLDLLKRMLSKNPLTRITASQALQHPYFTSQSQQLSQKLSPPNSPLFHVNSSEIQKRFPLQNKVSIVHDMQQINTIQLSKSNYLKHSTSTNKNNNENINKQNQYSKMKRQYSNRIRI